MNLAGIICEYNPFHLGHEYHIRETRRLLGEDTGIIAVMSGNFVQRGDCAQFSKHSRANAAVHCGADLVLELPAPWVLSSAEGFARGGVSILNSLGIVSHLSFGCEAGDSSRLIKAAEQLKKSEGMIKELMSTGISYASARQASLESDCPDLSGILSDPNNILGIEYISVLRELDSPIAPIAVTRKSAGHNDVLPSDGIAPASYIRNTIQNGGTPWEYLPASTAEIFKDELASGRAPANLEICERAILARLRTMTETEYRELPGVSEGLEALLMRYGKGETSLAAVLDGTKSKRYPLSRLRRTVLCAWLGIKKSDSDGYPPYIRVLAASKKGCSILKEAKAACTLPIITKPASAKQLSGKAGEIFRLEAQATALYNLTLPAPGRGDTEWSISPVICN